MENTRVYRKHSYQSGEVFGRLTLTGRNYLKSMYGQLRRFVEADCICGTMGWYFFESLTKGETKSCGCLRKELTSKRRTTHGFRKHPLYIVYRGMKERCFNTHHISYQNYGKRGITVCDEWLDNPRSFFDWAIESGWQNGLDIDRRENNGNYEPGNCRFVPPIIGSKNRRSSRLITAFGETKCISEWAEDKRCGVSYKALWGRLNRDKADWPDIEKAISTPPKTRGFNIKNRTNNKMITAFDEEKSMAEWLKDERCSTDEKRLRLRLRKGWTSEKALTTYIRKLR